MKADQHSTMNEKAFKNILKCAAAPLDLVDLVEKNNEASENPLYIHPPPISPSKQDNQTMEKKKKCNKKLGTYGRKLEQRVFQHKHVAPEDLRISFLSLFTTNPIHFKVCC